MSHRRRRAIAVTLLLGVASLIVLHAACDDPVGPGAGLSCQLQTRFPYEQAVLLVGDTGRMVVVLRDTSGLAVPGVEPVWSSSDPSVASVDPTGLVTARRAGSVVISADVCGGLGIEIAPRPASLEVAPDTFPLVPGNLGLVGLAFRDASGRPIDHWVPYWASAWRSTNAGVATVTNTQGDPGARVSAMAEGAAVITVALGELADTMVVVVAPVTLGPPDVGALHSCARSSDGSLYCWGDIQYGILPYGPGAVWGPAPAVVANPFRFVSLASGANHVCGITPADALYCMGGNEAGQLGVGVDGPVAGPGRVKPGTAFSDVTAGWSHTCAVTPAGQLFCWGLNDLGQLGTATTGDACTIYLPKGEPVTLPCSRVPVPAASRLAFATVRAGNGFTCGLTATGALHCWGRLYGPEPVPVGDGLSLVSFDLGGGAGSYEVPRAWACGLDAEGAAYCWGLNLGGLGDGVTNESWEPVPVAGELTFKALSVGDAACGLTVAGAIYCWGGGFSFAGSAVPVQVPGAVALETVSVGLRHACGRAADGKVYCWGSNDRGQLGVDGPDWSPQPTPVAGQR